MATSPVRLLDVDPDLGRMLTEEERDAAAQLTVPVLAVRRGDADVAEQLGGGRQILAALVLEGMLVQRLRIREQAVMRMLGPGDYLVRPGSSASGLLSDARWSVAVDSRLAVMGNELLAAIGRWPSLIIGWCDRLGAQSERLAAQLAICQLPRVADRLLGIMWLLADSWGRVTTSGVSLPLALTHESLGELIGARRPTVTLALGELVERGAIVRQDRGWLLLESLPQPEPAPDSEAAVSVLVDARSAWSQRPGPAVRDPAIAAGAELLETVARIRAEVEAERERVQQQLELARRTRESVILRRAEATRLTATAPPPAPSS